MNIDGRSVVVAGGVSGPGSATAQRFAELGARVGIADVACSIIDNAYLNGATLRLGAANRTPPRY